MVLRSKRIKDDRKATQAIRRVKPPTFDGRNHDGLTEWIGMIACLFVTYHVTTCICINLTAMQLKGPILNWWVQQQNSSAHDSWADMCSALTDHCQVMINESVGNQMSLYILRWAHWKRHAGELIQTYVDHFKT